MRDDLIFHVTTDEYFSAHKSFNNYKPETLDTKGYIDCSKGSQIEETANRIFSGENELLLLIIDLSTLSAEVKYETDRQTSEKFPHIYGPLNMDAVMDKFTIHAEEDGRFKITFSAGS